MKRLFYCFVKEGVTLILRFLQQAVQHWAEKRKVLQKAGHAAKTLQVYFRMLRHFLYKEVHGLPELFVKFFFTYFHFIFIGLQGINEKEEYKIHEKR